MEIGPSNVRRPRLAPFTLAQQALHHFPMDVSEPEVPPLELEGELLVVNAKEVKDGGSEVVNVHVRLDLM